MLCEVQLYIKLSERKCKIIFLDSSNPHVTGLSFYGEMEAVPDLSDVVKKFENLKVLQLSGKSIQIVERPNFAVFRRLETLILNENVITEIGADTFYDLSNLKNLNLTSNQLKETHRDLFKELHHLESLYLDRNQLEIVPEGLFRMNTKLAIINFNDNKIKVIDRDLFIELINLQWLILSENDLQILPEGVFRRNVKLERIDLGNNKIKSIHRNIFNELGRLNGLSLIGNQLEILPEDLFLNNKQLQIVLLQDNKITTIETDFQDLPSLVKLNLKDNFCIDESCNVRSFCGTNSRNEMQQKLMDKCPIIRQRNSFFSTFLCFVLINGAVFGIIILYNILT